MLYKCNLDKPENKIDGYILEILSNDVESYEIIKAELNNQSVPSKNVKIDNDDYYINKNNGEKFTDKIIIDSIRRLLKMNKIKFLDDSKDIKKVWFEVVRSL